MFGRMASLVLALTFLTAQQPVGSQTKGTPNGFDLVDKTGNIRKPADVRDLYQLLGTYTVEINPKGEEIHVTYASPGAAQYYRKNGKFADGTVCQRAQTAFQPEGGAYGHHHRPDEGQHRHE